MRDSTQSAADFVRVVWPAVQRTCAELRESTLRMVEGNAQNHIAYELDVYAGIDAYQRTAFGLRGITSRVQWGKDYHTFTVRIERPNGARTEYGKRITSLQQDNEGFLYPFWTIQAYIDRPGGTLLSAGLAKTRELYHSIEQRKASGHPCEERPAGKGGERFLVVRWEDYRRAGHYLFVYPPQFTPVSDFS